ncbi:MAG: type II toxin-antitoxin system RelE/ParE family toxin, partial [Schwartzia sp.]|nr:type II toxin-antitoxin system RelE/ParE family toxin [Schwartzia sp. (in: firmicutes)]
KDSRVKLNKIRDYIRALANHGTTLGEPYMKKIGGELWELRPLSDRILFASWTGSRFLLISHFVKKTQKTPPAEIEKAERLLKDFIERSGNDG